MVSVLAGLPHLALPRPRDTAKQVTSLNPSLGQVSLHFLWVFTLLPTGPRTEPLLPPEDKSLYFCRKLGRPHPKRFQQAKPLLAPYSLAELAVVLSVLLLALSS